MHLGQKEEGASEEPVKGTDGAIKKPVFEVRMMAMHYNSAP